MNKLAPLLLLLFLGSLPTGKSAAGSMIGHCWTAALAKTADAAPPLIRRLPASASAVRALARLLRAYAETPGTRQEPYRAVTTA